MTKMCAKSNTSTSRSEMSEGRPFFPSQTLPALRAFTAWLCITVNTHWSEQTWGLAWPKPFGNETTTKSNSEFQKQKWRRKKYCPKNSSARNDQILPKSSFISIGGESEASVSQDFSLKVGFGNLKIQCCHPSLNSYRRREFRSKASL